MESWLFLVGIVIIAGVILVATGNVPTGEGFGGLMMADIGQVLDVYERLFPESVETCEDEGGTWHSENDWWGCEGVGFDDVGLCTSEAGEEVKDQCEGMGAEWICTRNDVYCKY